MRTNARRHHTSQSQLVLTTNIVTLTCLRPAILELSGSEVDAQILRLGSFEQAAAGLVAGAVAAGSQLHLSAHYLLPAGAAPGAATDPSLQLYLQSDERDRVSLNSFV